MRPRTNTADPEVLRTGAAGSAGSTQAADVRTAALRTDELLGTSAVLQRHTVYLSMLGGFTAMLDGKTVAQERLRSRRCGEVLALLCIAPKHAMRRVQLVEILWPTLDFRSGNQRLYEALSVGRKALGSGRYSGYDPFVVSKGKGMVALNPDCVTCDIDLFQRAATEATKKEGIHEMVVEQASTARTLYGGDLDSAILHDIDEALQFKEHLRYIFATAMVAGARAAMATERQQLAVQFAQDACVACRTREDAAAALMARGRGGGPDGSALPGEPHPRGARSLRAVLLEAHLADGHAALAWPARPRGAPLPLGYARIKDVILVAYARSVHSWTADAIC